MMRSLGPLRSLLVLFMWVCESAACHEEVSSDPVEPNATPPEDRWTAFEAPMVTYFAVSGAARESVDDGGSGEDVFIVGEQGTILHWDGAALRHEISGTTVALRGVVAVGEGEAYAVGDAGTILHRFGGGWQVEGADLASEVLTAVWADTKRAVAVGETGAFLLRKAEVWKRIPNEYLEDLLAVTGGDSIAAVGALGMLLTLDGEALTRRPIPQFNKPLAGATTGPGGRWFVGLEGAVLKGQPGSLQPLEGAPPVFLRSVSAPGPDVWIVGWDGAILHGISGVLNRVAPFDERWMNGVYAASSIDVWVVGRSGLVLHGPPPRWSRDAGDDR